MNLPPRLARLPAQVLPGGQTILVADTFLARLRGLLGVDGLPPAHGLLLTRTRSVHTFRMRFALDLVWLDAGGLVLRVDEAVAPGTQRRCKGARAVIEMGAGDGVRLAAAAASTGVAIVVAH